MRALVLGSEVATTTAFFVPSMLLSSYHPKGKTYSCQLEIPGAEFLALLRAPYDKLVQELKRDDSIAGKTDFLGEAGYPALEHTLAEPQLLLELFSTYLADDFFTLASKRQGWTAVFGYFIKQFKSVEVRGGLVVFQAECLPYGCLNQPAP